MCFVFSDLGHSGPAEHYESSHWGQQPTYRSEASCSWEKAPSDRTDAGAWPSITGAETESASECTTDTDSASNCGSENSSSGYSGSAQGSFTGQTKKTNGNNGSNGTLNKTRPLTECPWGGERTVGVGGAARGGGGRPPALARAWLTAPSAAGMGNGQHDRRWEESELLGCLQLQRWH